MCTEGAEIINEISKFIPVFGGAIIGVLGGLVGTTYAHKLSRKTDMAKMKQSKLEELVSAVYEVDLWLKKEENYRLFSVGDEVLETSPVSTVEALQALYFPELSEHVFELSQNANKY